MSPTQKSGKSDSELDQIIARELAQLQGCLTPSTLARVAYHAQYIDPSYLPLYQSQLIVFRAKHNGVLKARTCTTDGKRAGPNQQH